MKKEQKNQMVIYRSKAGAIELRGDFKKETIWATQAELAKIFNVNPQAITKHIKNIYRDKELSPRATCSKMEQVRQEGKRTVKRTLEVYNIDVAIAVGYRINSLVGTKFRQWATKTLRQHIVKGYTINPKVVKNNYAEFQKAVANIKQLLPLGAPIDHASVLELISAFADTWLSLEAYDKDQLTLKGATKRSVVLTADLLEQALADFRSALLKKRQAGPLFGQARQSGALAGIVGNVL